MNKPIISDDQMEGLKGAWKQVIHYLQGLKVEQEHQSKLLEEKQTWKTTKHKITILKLK